MRNKLKIIFASVLSVMLLTMVVSCKKDPGFEGKSKIYGTVTYPEGSASYAIVQIKFDATSATESFDYTAASDAAGNYSFNQLSKGDYFIDATFTNNKGFVFNTPGYHVKIGGNKEEVEVNIALQ
jgi:hypothetical protein